MTAPSAMTGDELRAARVALGMDQRQLAAALDVTSQSVSNWERGRPIERRTALAVRYLLLTCPKIPEIEGEEWRDVVGWEGYYMVSSHGRVFSVPRYGVGGGLKSPHISTTDGYFYVNLDAVDIGHKLRAVHILVAEAFLGLPDEGFEVSHEDGNRQNPKLSNLKYRTRKSNLSLTIAHGTKLLGEKVGSAILTDEQVRQIKAEGAIPYDSEMGYSAIARRYGVDPETIAAIFKGLSWSHIPFNS